MNYTSGQIVAIANQKGGVGKTTTAINLCESLAVLNNKVLLIDADPQANVALGLSLNSVDYSTYHFLEGYPLKKCINNNLEVSFDIIPSSIELAKIELKDNNSFESNYFSKKIHPLKKLYDYIIIDCPPSIGNILIGILSISDSLIIPVQCEYFAFHGLRKILKTYKTVIKINPTLEIEGVLVTMYNKSLNGHSHIHEIILEHFESLVFKTIIPQNITLSEASANGVPAIKHNANSKGAIAYLQLASEILTKKTANNTQLTYNEVIDQNFDSDNYDVIEDLEFLLGLDQTKNDTMITGKDHYDNLIGMTKPQLKERLGQVFNDMNSNVWMYRISDKFSFFNNNYLYIFFKNNKVIHYSLRRFKLKVNHLNFDISQYIKNQIDLSE